jgi:hypothetical protein
VLEDRAEAQLWLGGHERLVPQLRELTGQYPLRERFHAQLMLALYRCGRQGEALAAYQDARRTLVEELGVEPGPQLRDLHGRILAGEDVPVPVTARAELAPANGAVSLVPRQLPAAPGHFTGRHGELELLIGLADPAEAADSADPTHPADPGDSTDRSAVGGGTVVISAIDGMAGIGKPNLGN